MNPLPDISQLLSGPLAEITRRIRTEAHDLHASVGQHYDRVHPYGFHLDAVAEAAIRFLPGVLADVADVAPVYFGAMFHDSMEDARLTYNNVMQRASAYFGPEQALMATEIVYALTNEKGRTRAERADERYYSLIRSTPYAPLVKAADRLANTSYSATHTDATDNHRMIELYRAEMPHFLASITDSAATDPRLTVPAELVRELGAL